jgi:predicted nucleotide-binding protein
MELSTEDKVSKLERRIKELDGFRPHLLTTFIFGSNDTSEFSPPFKEWQQRTGDTIKLFFGEHSRHVDNFNDIKYSNPLANLVGNSDERRKAFLKGLDEAEQFLRSLIDELKKDPAALPQKITIPKRINNNAGQSSLPKCVFIGHGRSIVWARLQIFLEKNLNLRTVNYESESRVGESIVPILEKMLNQATFAVLILTAEDETVSGSKRARQNVIHEAGLFQGKLGFRKAILLRQEGTEDFSNVAGLQYVSFSGDKIEQTFWELQEVLKREGQI